jgi:hypothetical protein
LFLSGVLKFSFSFLGFRGDMFLLLMLMVRACSHGLLCKLNHCSHGISTLN